MAEWIIVWAFLLFAKEGFADLASDKSGPYDVVIHYSEDCSETEDAPLHFESKMKRVDRNTLRIEFHVKFKIQFDDTLKATLQLDQKTNQGFKDNFFFTDLKGKGACSVMRDLIYSSGKNNLMELYKSNHTSCIIDPGDHQFEMNAVFGSPKRAMMFFYNTYRASLRFYKDLNQPPIGCMMVMLETVPKVKRRSH